MPIMPVANSQRNINASTGAPLRNEAAQEFAPEQIVVGAIQQTTQAWSDANDVMQYTKAKGQYEVSVADIQARAAADPNFEDSDKYYKELQDAKNQSLVGISNRQVAEKAALDMDFGNQMSAIKINSNFKQKEIIANKFNLSQSIEGLQQKKLQASTSGEAAHVDQDIQDMLALNIKAGVLSPAEAEAIKDDANILSAEYASTVSPDQFIANDAAYYGIPQDKYLDLKKDAISSKERGEKEQLEAQDALQEQSESELIMSLANQEIDRLSVPQITKQMIDGTVSTKFGQAYIRVLKSPRLIDANKDIRKSGFTEFAKDIFGSEDKEAQKAAIIRMLDGAADGKLNEEQLGVLLKTADQAGGKSSLIAGMINGLKTLSEGTNFSESKMVFSMMSAIAGGTKPEQAKTDAIVEEQVDKNPDRTKYTKGDMVDTPQGPMYVWGYYDDGDPDVRKEKPKQ